MKQVFLGTLTKPHGLKGAAFFNMENVEDSQIRSEKKIYLSKRPSEAFTVESLNVKGKRPIIKLKEVNSVEELSPLLPSDVTMDRDDFEKLNDGQFYLSDIINFEVIDSEKSEKLGEVQEFYSNGAQDIVVIKGNQEWDIPVEFIENVNWDEKIVKIRKPEYL